jgi:glucan phosphoethanolaminetransferase (alkaline phosphatase superfamily)
MGGAEQMNFSKLSASDKLAVYGAIATVIGAVIAASSYPGHWGVTWLGAILGIAMLALVFLPQMSPSTKLPGAHGSLMLIVGGVAALLMAYVLLSTFSFTFEGFDLSSLLFLVAVAGAIVMGWAGWQAFQAEGGKFNVGMAAEPFVPPPSAPPPAMTPPPSAPPAETDRTEDDTRP